MAFEQAPWREGIDGPISIGRDAGNDDLVVTIIHRGQLQALRMSEHNAATLFGSLALMLGISLPTALGKRIKIHPYTERETHDAYEAAFTLVLKAGIDAPADDHHSEASSKPSTQGTKPP